MNAAISTTPFAPKAESTEAQWVKSECIRQLMAKIVDTQWLLLLVMILMLGMLYGQAPTALLLTWFAANSLLSLCRLWFLRGYNESDKINDEKNRAKYFVLYAKLAPLNGFIWGISVYLFYDRASSNIAIFCLIIVATFGTFSATNLANYLPLLRRFLLAYGAGLMVAILAQIGIDQNFSFDVAQLWYTLLVVLFLFTLYRVGNRVNRTFVHALKLQHRNKLLINSLTTQRESALAAVATKNRMLASAAHDMRQPVLALDLYAGWLVNEPSASAELAPKIAASTKAVISLFDSMFDMSRLTEGQISTQLAPLKLSDLIADLDVQYQPIARAKNLQLRTRTIAGEVLTDPVLLERILGNLVSNAIKYSQTGGILLACRNSSAGVRIEIWDTGVGIAQDQQSLVFREFYKGTANVGTTDGFGLGLAIVTQLSELLGYELVLRSRPGRGTMVSLQLGRLL
jgi:signal transduction histidine kinase